MDGPTTSSSMHCDHIFMKRREASAEKLPRLAVIRRDESLFNKLAERDVPGDEGNENICNSSNTRC
jgi:hypothetical protein